MKWIYPYPVLFGEVAVHLREILIDGAPLPDRLVDTDHQEIHLIDEELERPSWSLAELEIEVAGPKTELREFAEDHGWPTAMSVAHCGPSNTRQAFDLMQDERDPTVWRGRMELDRSAWFGRITVRTLLMASVDGVAHRVIGEAPDWTLRLDDLPRPPVHGAIKIRWDDFSAPDELAILDSYANEPAFLHLDPDEPVLYLNRSFEGLEALLRDRRGRAAGEQALHDQTRATIATEAWAAMFNSALLGIRSEDEDADFDWPESEWQRTVLEIFGERMYPDKSPIDALREFASTREDGAAGVAIQERVLPAISAHVGVPKLLRAGIRRLGSLDGDE